MKLLKQINKWQILLVILVVLIAYGQTLNMYFWQDDSALIFKLQNPEGPAGSFGYGIIGSGAYKYLVTPFVPFYPLFKLEPFWYFLVGLLTYFVVVFAFWLFVKELFKDKKASYLSTLLFAAGYVGSDIMFRVINSWQSNIGLVIALLSLLFFVRFARKRNLKYYLSSLVFYFLAVEIVFIRNHGLIFLIILLDILFITLPRFKVKKLGKFFLRQLPFWFIFQTRYLSDESFGAPGITSLLQDVFVRGEIEKLSPLFANTGNGIVQTALQSRSISFLTNNFMRTTGTGFQIAILHFVFVMIFLGLGFLVAKKVEVSKKQKVLVLASLILGAFINYYFYSTSPLWYRNIQPVIAGLIGIEVLIISFWGACLLWSKNRVMSSAIVFGILTVASQIGAYYIQYPTSVFSTTHRYFNYSLIGYSIFWGTLIYLTRKTKISYLLIFFTLVLNLYLGFGYQAGLVEARSNPTRKFYQDLTSFVPQAEKGSAFYFDVSRVGISGQQFADFFSVGSMPETTALAIYYGVDRYDVSMYTSFNELVSDIASGEVETDKLHTFYYDKYQGLVNTTEKTRQILMTGPGPVSVDIEDIEIKPLTPVLLQIEARAEKGEALELFTGDNQMDIEEKEKLIEYLVARQDYYSNVSADSVSEWKFREVRNAVDNDVNTPWQGHRIWWHDEKDEKLVVNLNEAKSINKVVWTNWKPSLTPVSYKIQTSMDGETWETVKVVEDGGERRAGEMVVEGFDPIVARQVRMDIDKTLLDDSPAILEFEVVGSQFEDVDIKQALSIAENPLAIASSKEEWDVLYDLARPLAKLIVDWDTNKRDVVNSVVETNLAIDGNARTYEVVMSAGGTKIEDIAFDSNIPANIEIVDVRAKNLTISEMQERGIIQEFSEN